MKLKKFIKTFIFLFFGFFAITSIAMTNDDLHLTYDSAETIKVLNLKMNGYCQITNQTCRSGSPHCESFYNVPKLHLTNGKTIYTIFITNGTCERGIPSGPENYLIYGAGTVDKYIPVEVYYVRFNEKWYDRVTFEKV